MASKIKLGLIVQEMEAQSDEMSSFYDKESRQIIPFMEEEIRMAENEVSTQELSNWLQEAVKVAEEVIYEDKYIPLPSKFEIHEYAIMEKFCLSIRNNRISDLLYDSIKGRKKIARQIFRRRG